MNFLPCSAWLLLSKTGLLFSPSLYIIIARKHHTEKLNSWIGTVGAVKNKTSLIGIGHLKSIYPYWLAMDFAGNLGMVARWL